MKLKSLIKGFASGLLVLGATQLVAISTTSCSKKKKKDLISVVQTEDAILNKASYVFSCDDKVPEKIQLVWFNNPQTAKKVQIVNNSEIPVDPSTKQFTINFVVKPLPKEWKQINIGLSFQYKIGEKSYTSSISDLILKNGTIQTENIHINYGTTKVINDTVNPAKFNFYFDMQHSSEMPSTIDNVEIIDLDEKYQQTIHLQTDKNIPVDPLTGEIDLSIFLSQSVEEVISFTLLFSYEHQGQIYCYYSDPLSIIFYDSDDTNKTYMKLVALEDGNISYTNSNLESLEEKNLFYRINNAKYWSYLKLNETIYLKKDDTIEFAGINDTWSNYANRFHFKIGPTVTLTGSPEALLHGGVVSNTLSGQYCFSKLFSGCTSIQAVSSDFLPMHILTEHCYDSMFEGCSNLTSGEFQLPAKLLERDCYRRLFAKTKIEKIKYFANSTLSEDYSFEWLEDCNNLKEISIPSDMELYHMEWSTSTIPSQELSKTFDEPLTILSKENGPLKLLGYDENDVVDTSYTETNKQVLYSFNYPLENFKPAPIYSDSIYLKKGEYIYIQGNNPEGWYEKIECQDKHHIGFNIEFKSDLQGSMMSLIDPTLSTKQIPFTDSEDEEAGFPCLFAGSNIETIGSKVLQVEDVLPPSCFRKTFYDCPNLINLGGVINLVVSLELKPHCCEDMFCMCTSIESLDGSKHMIPKNDYADSCYKNMFSSCVNLKEAPLVTRQDKDMKPHCLEGMFSFCRSLQSSQPVISASADKYCYAEMFEGCDSLIECPETDCIQIGSADQYCFYGMYKGCTVIKDIPELKKHIWPGHACESMFESCTSLAPKGPTESSHHNFIYISEDNLHTYCFKKMFADCQSIVNIYIDLDNWGEDFETLEYLSSVFEDWVPKKIKQGRTIWLRNWGSSFDFENIPSVFAPIGFWSVQKFTDSN